MQRNAPATWTTIAPNICDDGSRYIATASIGRRRRRRKRFPRATPIRTITTWIADTCAALRAEQRTSRRLSKKLAGEIAGYLDTFPKGRPRNDTTALLHAWALALGDVGRAAIRPDRLQTIVSSWIEDGVAASTLKHRRRAFAQFADRRGDRALAAAIRALTIPAPPKATARGVDMHLLHAIISAMDEHRSGHPGRGGRGFRNKARARLLLMLWTGIAPASLKRLSPTAIDLERRTLTLPPRHKGAGAASVTVPLRGQGPAAAQAWLRAHAWGTFDNRALGRAFYRAVKAYVAAEAAAGRAVVLPADLRPYDLRHSCGTWLYARSGDLKAVKEYLQHTSLATTERYTLGAVSDRLQALADAIDAA